MANLKITQVPQGSSVGTTDDIYIKTGSNFRRVPVSKLIELMNAQGFFQKGLNGIPTTDLYVEQVIISPDDDSFVSNKTYSQILAAEESGAEIQCEFYPGDGSYLRGMVLDITDSEALLAFLVPGPGPHISIFAVTDLTVTETRIPISGQPCRAVCNTEEETTAKVASVQGGASGLFSLYDGATVYVYFTYAVVPGSTLNINSTGAKLIDFCGSTGIPAESFAQFFYHEALGKWILIGGGGGGSGMTDDIKTALLNAFAHVAWADADGQDYYDALESALYPEVRLVSISASYDQDRPIYTNDTQEEAYTKIGYDLTVTAHNSDGTSEVVTGYTLSGSLSLGTNTITVAYQGKTTTITVTCIVNGWLYRFEQSLASDGSKDIGWSGSPAYATGHDGTGYAYDNGSGCIQTTSYTPPNMSGDFSISWWQKCITQNTKGQGISPFKVASTSAIADPTGCGDASNVKSGYTVTKDGRIGKGTEGIRIFWSSDKFQIRCITSDLAYGANYNVTMPTGFDATQWHHYAVTRKDNTLRFFVDGEVVFTATMTLALFWNTQVAFGGYYANAGDTSATQGSYRCYYDDLFIAEWCKWDSSFDPSAIAY